MEIGHAVRTYEAAAQVMHAQWEWARRGGRRYDGRTHTAMATEGLSAEAARLVARAYSDVPGISLVYSEQSSEWRAAEDALVAELRARAAQIAGSK